MLNRLFKALWGKESNKDLLGDILSHWQNRENLLGVQRVAPVSPEQIRSDVEKIISYSTTSDYLVYAEKVWTDVLDCMDKLSRPDTKGEAVDFYRGKLNASLEHLRVSYQARSMKEQMAKDKEQIRR